MIIYINCQQHNIQTTKHQEQIYESSHQCLKIIALPLKNLLIGSSATLYNIASKFSNLTLTSTFFRCRIACPRTRERHLTLLTLDGSVYVADKEQGGAETHHTEHEEEGVANASHVTEEERCLHKSRHVGPGVVVV